MRIKPIVLYTALFAGIAGGGGLAQATVYDVNADFSVASNPNGVWTYGFETTLGGALTLYDQTTTTDCGSGSWKSSTVQLFGAPVDCSNKTSSQSGFIPANSAGFHPGPNGEYSVFRFTTPTLDTYDLLATFGAADSGGTDVHILLNGASLYSHEVDPNNTPETFSTSLALLAGDLIDFAVGVGTDGNFFSDSTSINASLTTQRVVSGVPEPASLALFVGALMGLGWMRRRKPSRPD